MTDISSFLKSFTPDVPRNHENDLIKKSRSKAINALEEYGIPNRDLEPFRYTRFLDRLFSTKFSAPSAFEGSKDKIETHIFPECADSTLVFMNGYYRPDLSSVSQLKQCVLLPLDQAARTYNPLLSASWTKTTREEKDPFALMNLSYFQEGIFIYIPPNVCLKSAIHIHHTIADVDSDTWIMPRIHLLAGHHSEVTIIETINVFGTEHLIYHNSHLLIELEENAILHHAHVALDKTSTPMIHTDSLRAFLKSGAQFVSTSYVAPSVASRRSYAAWLKGDGANATINGSWMLSGKEEAHSDVYMQHDAPHTTSMQLFKGVLQDESRSSFEGKIFVSQIAQKTQAYQLNNNLILGDSAHAFSKPNLEIIADDVKASHGSTTGQLDDDALFYLQSRGLPKQEARRCLIEGFLSEVASKIEVPSLHNLVVDTIHKFCR